MVKKILLLAAVTLLAVAGNVKGQTAATRYTVTGEIADSTTKAGIGYATIAAMDSLGSIVTAVAADGVGRFHLELKQAGNYSFAVTAVGYTSRSVAMKVAERRTDAGKIALTAGVEIGAVEVTAQKPLITTDDDKLSYSVEADPEAETSTLLDILRKVPQLSVDADGNVLLNGQSDYKVLVNGKTSTMYTNNFKEIIRSLPANSVKDIEVITNPSMKYEAEGVGGIINIVTNRKMRASGYSGRINAGYSSYDSWNAGAYLATQIGKLNLSANYSYSDNQSPGSRLMNTSERFFPNDSIVKTSMIGDGKHYNLGQNLSLEASYEIDSLNLITFSVWGYFGKNGEEGILSNSTIDGHSGQTLRSYDNYTSTQSTWGWISGSLDYQRSFRKPKKMLTLSYKLEYNPISNFSDNDVTNTYMIAPYHKRSDNSAASSEHTVQVDYVEPFGKRHNVEAGLKYILRRNTSETIIETEEDGVWTPLPGRDDALDYDQHILSVYGGYQYKLTKTTYKAGFRAEEAINDGTVGSTIKTRLDTKMFNVVPYFNFSFQPNKKQTYRASYTQRLRRPGIYQLNPYVDNMDPYNLQTGNPNLKAAVANAVAVNATLVTKIGHIYVGTNASITDNTINEVTRTINDSVRLTTYENIGNRQSYSANFSYNFRLPSGKFSFGINASADYSIIESPSRNLRNEGWNYNLGARTTVTVWKDGTLSANYYYSAPRVALQGKSSGYSYSSLGFTQKLFKQKLDISLRASNPFEKYRDWRNEKSGADFAQMISYRIPARTFGMSMGYRFGQLKSTVKKTGRSISNDDKMDGGGQGGQATAQ